MCDQCSRAVKTVFQYVSDKEQAWKDLIELTSDQESSVRWSAAEAVGTVWRYVPDKEQAWKDYTKTSDQNSDVRWKTAKAVGTVF